ncbi:hypothetical protein NMG60_11015626 [Bertholletia excelsa]
MEGRLKKCRAMSPERTKVWTEKSPKYQQNRKVPVVYYLCRNRQLEHPHFIEVPVSSAGGLYLRDFIARLNSLRGRGLASGYSWSCKSRSYKNGFVWHDLSVEDLILPAQGNEYVLKGSELFEECYPSGCLTSRNTKMQNLKQLPEPPSLRCHGNSLSSSSMNGGDMKYSQEDELSPLVQHPGSSVASPESRERSSSPCNHELSAIEYTVYNCNSSYDASTQTEENISRANKSRETCSRGTSMDDRALEQGSNEYCQNQVQHVNETSDASRNLFSPPPPSSSAFLSGGQIDTLDSLIRADACKISRFRNVEEEEFRMPSSTKLKATNLLMQLISCGSISVKGHSFGINPTYRPRFSHSKFPPPFLSTSLTLGEPHCPTDNPKLMGPRNYKQLDATPGNEGTSACSKQSARSESMRSPVCDGPRISFGVDSLGNRVPNTSIGSRGKMAEPLLGVEQSVKPYSIGEGNKKVVRIEESLLQELGL